MPATIRRTTLLVRDMEKSVQWYEQVLGLTRYYDDMYTLTGTGFAVGKEGDKTHLVIMQGSHHDMGMIGLVQFVDPPLPAPDEIPTSITYGNPTFIVAVDDCRKAWERARALGTHIHVDPHEWSVKGPKGETRNYLSTSVFDPDGHFFELNEMLSMIPAD